MGNKLLSSRDVSITRKVSTVAAAAFLLAGSSAFAADVMISGDVTPAPAVTPNWNVGGSLIVGFNGTGTLDVEAGGVVTNEAGFVGALSGSEGTATVTGDGSQWNNSSSLRVGDTGTGTLAVEAGGVVSNTAGTVGASSGSEGTATVTGIGSQWNSSSDLRVGNFGTGTLNVEAGGVVSSAAGNVGVFSGSVSTATVTGSDSQWNNSSDLRVGDRGTGTLKVEFGGAVSATSVTVAVGGTGTGTINLNSGTLTTGQLREGGGSGGGTVTFDGGILKLTGNQAALFDGFEAGDVTLAAAGGTIDTQAFNVGSAYALSGAGGLIKQGTGSLTLTGANTYTGETAVRNGTLGVTGSITHPAADMKVGQFSGDDGTLEISGTGTVSSNYGFIGRSSDSTGLAKVSGGSWTNAGQLVVGEEGDGTLEISGTGAVSNTDGFIAGFAESTGLAKVSGGSWTNSGQLLVGLGGDGTLEVSGTGTVSNTIGSIGAGVGSTGLVKVSGGSWTNDGVLEVGDSGDGTLEISGTGVVSNSNGFVGFNADSEGTASVTGVGSEWNNSGELYVGFGGTGTLDVEAGGVVSNTEGSLGRKAGSEGAATVTGVDSEWNNSGFLSVGYIGNGTLDVEAGGVVSNSTGYLGFAAGSEGSATVTGAGSRWNNSGFLYVGNTGTGTLDVEAGGVVSNSTGYLGRNTGSEGTATVSGAGSQWNNSSSLTVGNVGDGTLEITGGVVSATSVYVGQTAASTGTINIGTGTSTGLLNTAFVNGGVGSSTLNFNHTDADYFFTNNGTSGGTAVLIYGDMDVNHLGSGATTLLGANIYTGATGVDAGSLYVQGSLGNTAVTVANSATLGGSGSIAGGVTVQSGGTLAPGSSPGILTVGSLDLLSGSFTSMELTGLTPGLEHDKVLVIGTANLDGTLDLDLTGGSFVNGDSFTLIEADAINNDFASINYLYGKEIVYETEITDDYIFRILAITTDFAGLFGLDPELVKIAQLIDDNFADAGLIPIINELNLLMEGDQAIALEQINPQELTALPHFTFANARGVSMRLKNRQREVRNGATGFSTAGFNLYDETGQHIRQSLLADRSGSIPAGTKTQGFSAESKLSSYLSGSGTMRDFDGDSNGPGYEDDSFAVLLGADYRLADNLAVGAYLGYNHTNADLGGDGGNADLDSYRLGVTGTHWNPLSDGSNGIQRSYYTTAHAGLAMHDYATDRNAFGGDARGDTDAFEFDLGAAIGYEVDYTDFVLTTELSLDYVNLDTDGFTEKGSLAPLTIADDRSESLYSTLSVRMDFSYQIADIDVLPYVQIGWRHEFMDDSNSVAARFAASPGIGGFTVEGANADRDSLIASLGMTALINDGLTARLGYFGEFSPDFQSHSLNGSINFAF